MPLFLLALPMLSVLGLSSYWSFCLNGRSNRVDDTARHTDETIESRILIRLSLPQLLVAILTLTNFHVQIINRISSGYPLWYIWLANLIDQNQTSHGYVEKKATAKFIVQGIIIYGLIQAALYASFLPPA